MIQHFETAVYRLMRRCGVWPLQWSLAVIYIWFGILKPLGKSPAEPLVLETAAWLPLFSPETWLGVIGVWEVVIGVCFLFRRTLKPAIVLLTGHIFGTFLPMFLLTSITFQDGFLLFGPTMEGQYIIKNVLIVSAAVVIGGTLSPGRGGAPAASLSAAR